MIAVIAVVAVASWKALDVLGWVGGRGARRVERSVGMVFAVAILAPIYLFHDSTPLTAVAQEMTKPIVAMVNHYVEHVATP